MAPTIPAKKAKKSGDKASLKPKRDSAVAPAVAESSSKPVKALKRKKNVEEEEEPTVEEDATVSKKAKKSDAPALDSSKASKARAKEASDAEEVPAKPKSNKKKGKTISESATTPTEPLFEEKIKKSKTKAKPTEEPTAPPSTSKESSKKSKPAPEMPTSISRPRKPEPVAKPLAKTKFKKAKEPTPAPESSDEAEEKGAEAEGSDENEDVHLHGFSTDDEDSSDDDAMNDEPSEFDVGKLPTIAKDDETVKRKLEKAKRQPTEDRGVLFLGRLPHGFYEDQLRAYFSQFGTVTRLRVSRNKKTGRSKHYGFLEFDSSAVAQIVADTMDNYLLMGHIMRCKLIPKDEVHPELWVGANRKWRLVPQDRVTRIEHNKPRTEDEQKRAAKRLMKRQEQRKRKLAEAGIKYDFDAASYKMRKAVVA